MTVDVCAGISSVVHQVQALQLLALLLPEANRETLKVNLHPQLTTPSLHHDITAGDLLSTGVFTGVQVYNRIILSHGLIKKKITSEDRKTPHIPP